MTTTSLLLLLLLFTALGLVFAEPPWTGGTRPSRAPASLDCPLRHLVATYASSLNTQANATDIARSLQLSELCGSSMKPHFVQQSDGSQPGRPLWEAGELPTTLRSGAGLCSLTSPPPLVFFVAPDGSDAGSGSQASPFATLQRALDAVGSSSGGACIWVRAGTYFMSSGPATVGSSNLEIAAFPGEPSPVLTGSLRVPTPRWAFYSNSTLTGATCWRAPRAAPLNLSRVSALWVSSDSPSPPFSDPIPPFMRARWPNIDRGDAPYPAAWASAGSAGVAWAPPPIWQQCESNVTTVPSPCFENYTEQGGMAPCFESRTGCGSLRFDPPIEPGTPRSVCGSSMSPLCNTVPGGLNFLGWPTAFTWPWAHPEDALVHGMKNIDGANSGFGWYSLSWEVDGGSSTSGGLVFGRGGFQSGQGKSADGTDFHVALEGPLELLDAPGEWHYDVRTGDVYLCTTSASEPPSITALELATQQYLLAVQGGNGGTSINSSSSSSSSSSNPSAAAPVSGVSIRGLHFARTRSTILEGHRVPGGGDLAAHPRGAVTVSGVEGVTIANCTFTDVGGSALVVTGHALGVQVVDSSFAGAGAHSVLILGSSILNDATGPELPRGVRVAGNSIRGAGRENKFAAPIALALAPRGVVEGNIVYECPRTAVYYNDLSGSPGQLLYNNVLFNSNRETVDTGPVYTYQRLAFLGDNEGGPSVVPDVSNLTSNLILSTYGANWPLDMDDGSTRLVDSMNVFLYGGNKQYLGCCTTHSSNFLVFPDLSDNNFNLCNMQDGAELYRSGYDHHFFNNTCILSSATALAYSYGDCNKANAIDPPRITSHGNTFLSPGAGAQGLAGVPMVCGKDDFSMEQWSQVSGMESGSTAGPLPDPQALATQLLAFLPGPQAGGSGKAWGR